MTRREWIKLTLVSLYLLQVPVTTGFINANLQHNACSSYPDEHRQREELAFAMFLGLMPIGWVITPFVTGFYQDGWTLSVDCPREK